MINFFLSLQGGIYVLTLIDEYAAGFATMINGIFMCIAIGWVYGVRQFCSDIKQMIGHSVGYWWKAMWKVISPIIITVSKSSHLEEVTLSTVTLNVSHRKTSTSKCYFSSQIYNCEQKSVHFPDLIIIHVHVYNLNWKNTSKQMNVMYTIRDDFFSSKITV